MSARTMTPAEAVAVLRDHLEAVKRGDPRAIEVDREAVAELRRREAERVGKGADSERGKARAERLLADARDTAFTFFDA